MKRLSWLTSARSRWVCGLALAATLAAAVPCLATPVAPAAQTTAQLEVRTLGMQPHTDAVKVNNAGTGMLWLNESELDTVLAKQAIKDTWAHGTTILVAADGNQPLSIGHVGRAFGRTLRADSHDDTLAAIVLGPDRTLMRYHSAEAVMEGAALPDQKFHPFGTMVNVVADSILMERLNTYVPANAVSPAGEDTWRQVTGADPDTKTYYARGVPIGTIQYSPEMYKQTNPPSGYFNMLVHDHFIIRDTVGMANGNTHTYDSVNKRLDTKNGFYQDQRVWSDSPPSQDSCTSNLSVSVSGMSWSQSCPSITVTTDASLDFGGWAKWIVQPITSGGVLPHVFEWQPATKFGKNTDLTTLSMVYTVPLFAQWKYRGYTYSTYPDSWTGYACDC